jgi:hypothetical protein
MQHKTNKLRLWLQSQAWWFTLVIPALREEDCVQSQPKLQSEALFKEKNIVLYTQVIWYSLLLLDYKPV